MKKVALMIALLAMSSPACADRVQDLSMALRKATLSTCSYDVRGEPQSCVGWIKVSGSPIFNAYSKRGNITLNRGLVDALNDDELAFVIGHEMAHAILGHNTPGHLGGVAAELEADRYGVRFAMRAGYDPEAAVSVIKKGTLTWLLGFPFSLLSHPITGTRIKAIREAAREELTGA